VASQLAIENSVSALIMAGSSALKRAEEKAKTMPARLFTFGFYYSAYRLHCN